MRALVLFCLFVSFLTMLSSPVYGEFKTPPGSRRVVAFTLDGGRVFISWRYKESDHMEAKYEVKRSANKTGPYTMACLFRKEDGTNFIDSTRTTGKTCYYFVITPTGTSRIMEVKTSETGDTCLVIPTRCESPFRKLAAGDLNGDGLFEFIILRPEGSRDSSSYSTGRLGGHPPSVSGNSATAAFREKIPFKVEAYTLEGEMLWHSRLGTGTGRCFRDVLIVAWDLDGDGKEEVIIKDAECDACRRPPADDRERMVVLDPTTGKPSSRAAWPDRFPELIGNNKNAACAMAGCDHEARQQLSHGLPLFWDGSLQRQLAMDGKIIRPEELEVLATYLGEPVCIADVLGDWREELITRDGSLIRIYTTSIPTNIRRPSLMDDRQYRLYVARTAMDN